MNSMESRGVRNPQKMTASLATVFVVLTISFLAAVPVEGQTATYSDAYVIDNSGVTYDPENDADVIPQEQGGPNQIAGVGVTEADYNGYSESVETTLTGPDGQVVSASSSDDPYARVEVTLTPMDGDTEYEYNVETVHSYWVEEPDGSDCGNGPCMIQTA